MKEETKEKNNKEINEPVKKKSEPIYTKASVDMDMPD